MSDDILEDLIVKPLGAAIEQMTVSQLREHAESIGIYGHGRTKMELQAAIRAEEAMEEVRGRVKEARSKNLQKMQEWEKDNPTVGTIERHLKQADAEVQRAWEEAVQSTVKAWEKEQLGHAGRWELELVIKHLGNELLPALVSAASFHAPVAPVEKPKVDADRVIKALEKDPVLMREVREKLRAYKWDAVQGSWKIVRMEGNTTKKLTLNLPDDAPTGEYTIMLSAKEYWPGHVKCAVRFHVVGGEIEGGNAASAPSFPIKRMAHLDGGPNRKIVAHIQTTIEGYLRGVRLEAIPHGG